jgi:ERCC4-type nuclease
MIKIVLDSRETSLISCMKERDLDKYDHCISIEVQVLNIGDIHVCFNDSVWVMERKTVADLVASIKDGRYKEQKSRLLSSGHNVTYIIEGGDIVSSKHERHQNMLSGVYIHSMYRDNIHLAFTRDVSETCTYIMTLATKMVDNPQYFKYDKAEYAKPLEYVDCLKLKSKKIDNITPDNCFIMQLAQIPTISSVIAKNIQSVYPTMRDFMIALENAKDNDARLHILCEIDKIGQEKAKKILQFLHYNA